MEQVLRSVIFLASAIDFWGCSFEDVIKGGKAVKEAEDFFLHRGESRFTFYEGTGHSSNKSEIAIVVLL